MQYSKISSSFRFYLKETNSYKVINIPNILLNSWNLIILEMNFKFNNSIVTIQILQKEIEIFNGIATLNNTKQLIGINQNEILLKFGKGFSGLLKEGLIILGNKEDYYWKKGDKVCSLFKKKNNIFCNSPCLKCEFSSNICSSCYKGYFLSKGKCVTQCEINLISDSSLFISNNYNFIEIIKNERAYNGNKNDFNIFNNTFFKNISFEIRRK